jgi:hypothetical protein
LSVSRTHFLEIDNLKSPDKIQRIERAGMLPARFCDFRKERSLGFAEPDTSRAMRPLTRMAGDTRIWRTNGFDCYFL